MRAEESKKPPTRKRRPQVCNNCRVHKVKCNIAGNGFSCTYCSQRDLACTACPPKRRKKRYISGPRSIDSASQFPTARRLADLNGTTDFVGIGYSGSQRSPEPGAPFEDGNSETFLHRTSQDPILHMTNAASLHGDLMATPLDEYTVKSKPKSASIPIPAFIKELPSSIPLDDIQYLWTTGALSIPDVAFRNKLIQSFVEHVYPSLPLIHLHEFLRTISNEDQEEEKLSLLLFQAILFAGTMFVDLPSLHAAGYSSRREARRAFHQKVKLLYEFDCEVDRLALVQSLLLMTYLNETERAGKDEWHWLGIAISLAYAIGLHRNSEAWCMDLKTKRLWKRIWWSCYLRDRFLALGMRRPTRINDSDYDVPMLCLDDFEIDMDNESPITFPRYRLASDISLQRELATIYVAKITLCRCIGRVLATQYVPYVQDHGREPDHECRTRSRTILSPKISNKFNVRLCEVELANWLKNLPNPCRYVTPKIEDSDNTNSSVLLERAVLHMAFFATLCAFHRPRVVLSTETTLTPESRISQTISWSKVRQASNEITKITLDLYNLNLTRYLPATAVTALLPAMTSHLIDTKLSCNAIREEALRTVSRCMIVLQELRESYEPADVAFHFLEQVTSQANITITSECTTKNAASPDPIHASDCDNLATATTNDWELPSIRNTAESYSPLGQSPLDYQNVLLHTETEVETEMLECEFQIQQSGSLSYDGDWSSSIDMNKYEVFDTEAMGPLKTDCELFGHYFNFPVD